MAVGGGIPIKLTIGIPTFNGWDCLESNIQIILKQIASLDEVELLICDNASNDETEEGVKTYLGAYPNKIRYVRHVRNMGMDANFWSIVKNAQGQFVHFLGDDDYYESGGVQRVLEVLKSYDVDYCVLSNLYLNTLNGRFIRNQDNLGGGIYVQKSGEGVILNEGLKSLALSNIVIKRSNCLGVDDVEQYFGCQWLHLLLVVKTLRQDSSAYIFGHENPVVCIRIGNQRWLERDGAIAYYCSALEVFSKLKEGGFDDRCLDHIKKSFLPLLSNGAGIKFKKLRENIPHLLQLGKYYYKFPKAFLLVCVRVIFRRHRPFFSGWEEIGEKRESA